MAARLASTRALAGERRKEVAVALHARDRAGAGRCVRGRAASLARAGVPRRRHRAAGARGAGARAAGSSAGWATPRAIAAGLLAGSVALVLARPRAGAARARRTRRVRDALWLGLAQAAALVPGVSRSGATRAVARARGFTRAAAAELSAEVALPVLAGATALKGVRLARRRPPRRAAARARRRRGGGGRLDARAALRLERAAAVPPAAWAAYRTGARARRPRLRPAAAREWAAMSGAYATSGVDTGAADRAVGALVGVLKTIDAGRASRSVLASGHYAAVLEVAPNLGIAVGTDGVGSKLIVAEQTGRYDTVGIDCIAMNVNDVICVGAEPIAVLDYLAVERADADVLREIGVGLKAGAEAAGVEIPGGEVAVLPELIRGHPSPNGFDLTAACFGTVALDAVVTGAACRPGDALIGLPSSGLHSNGYSLARRALLGDGGLALDDRAGGARRRLGGRRAARADGDLRARACSSCCAPTSTSRGLAHITGGGLLNLLRLHADVGFEITDPLPVPPVFDARARARRRRRGRDVGGLQHGLRLLRRRARGRRGRRRRDPRPPPPGRRAGSARSPPTPTASPCRRSARGGPRPGAPLVALGGLVLTALVVGVSPGRRRDLVVDVTAEVELLGVTSPPSDSGRRPRRGRRVALLALPVLAGALDLVLEAAGALLHVVELALGSSALAGAAVVAHRRDYPCGPRHLSRRSSSTSRARRASRAGSRPCRRGARAGALGSSAASAGALVARARSGRAGLLGVGVGMPGSLPPPASGEARRAYVSSELLALRRSRS